MVGSSSKDPKIMIFIDILLCTKWKGICFALEPSRGTFQSSNPIGQYIIHDYIRICAIALTQPIRLSFETHSGTVLALRAPLSSDVFR